MVNIKNRMDFIKLLGLASIFYVLFYTDALSFRLYLMIANFIIVGSLVLYRKNYLKLNNSRYYFMRLFYARIDSNWR